MLDILFKKKLKEEKLAKFFTTSILNITHEGFDDIVDSIVTDSAFETVPVIDRNEIQPFIMIVIAGNLKFLSENFNDYQDVRLQDQIIRNLARELQADLGALKKEIGKYQNLISKINLPSKNTLYGMSKAVFDAYNLYPYQEEYFKNMKSFNPIFIKNLNHIMKLFIFDWVAYREKYKIVQ